MQDTQEANNEQLDLDKLKEDLEIGQLAIYKDLTEEQKDLLLKLVSYDESYLIQVLYNVYQDNILVLEILDIFAGKFVKFPTRKKIYKILEKVRIYTYMKQNNNSESAVKYLSEKYNKRYTQIRDLVSKIDKVLQENLSEDNKYKNQISREE